MTKLHVIIPVFNGWPQTKICLDALRASTYRNLEIIIVDHGSTDETKKALPALYPEVVHLLGEPTLWWSGATNLGIRWALDRDAQSLMLLNHDCYVEPDTIQKLVSYDTAAKGGVIAPIQKDYFTNRILTVTATTCFLLGFTTVIPPGQKHPGIGKHQLLPTKLIIGGRGVLIPAAVFRRVGLFDEINLPHAGADNDFYLRCRKQGVPLFIAPDATVAVDNTRTSLAARAGHLNMKDFMQTLVDRRSHRNFRDLAALFKLHYPVKGLHYLGVGLNLLRYGILYGWWRLTRALGLA